jgi:hypothetical protein
MKRTLKMIVAELQAWELTIEIVPKYYRRREHKGMKQFYVKGGGIDRWTGDDGEPNYSPRLCVFIAVKSVSDITFAMICDEYRKTHGGIEIEAGLSIAKKAEQLEQKKIAKCKAEYDEEKILKEFNMKLKANESEWTIRLQRIALRFASGISNKLIALNYFAKDHSGSIIADHYRDEFVRLIQDPRIMQMAIDLAICLYPYLDDRMLQLNERARELKIRFESLGAVTSAIKYLCQDFI